MSEPTNRRHDRVRSSLRPRGRARLTIVVRELWSAIGKEGTIAGLVFLLCALVIGSGWWVVARTWGSDTERMAELPVVGIILPPVDLALYWLVFGLFVGISGSLLSSQVTKPWLRAFVGASLLLSVLLLVTIGRNARVDQAASNAQDDARRLAATVTDARNQSVIATSLIQSLCEQGGIEPECFGDMDVDTTQLDDEARSRAELTCLPGWTLAAFEKWLEAASLDRREIALSALASCEIGAVSTDPQATPPEPAPTEGTSAEIAEVATELTEQELTEAERVLVLEEGRSAIRAAMSIQRSELKAHEAIAAGADELLSYASGPTKFAEFRFSAAAWLLLLGGALLWYRQLEIISSARRLGPVDIQFERVGGNDDKARKGAAHEEAGTKAQRPMRIPMHAGEAVFKESVIGNVPEPGAVPGAQALAPVGDLVAQSDVPNKWLIGGVLDAVRTIFAAGGGFTVVYSARTSSEGPVVFVRLRQTRTGTHLGSDTFPAHDIESAAQLAGYWVAGWIISRSNYVPDWARWSEHDAWAFHGLDWTRAEPGGARPRVRSDPDDIDPSTVNSMILAQRAYTYQISAFSDGRLRQYAALEDFARAVHRRPRYPVARYRRSAALSELMHYESHVQHAVRLPDGTIGPPTRSRLRYVFGDLILADRGRLSTPSATRLDEWLGRLDEEQAFPLSMRLELLLRVARWSHENRVAIRWRHVARLRPSERSFWKDFGRHRLARDWIRVLDAEICLCIERLRQIVAAPVGEAAILDGSVVTPDEREDANDVAAVVDELRQWADQLEASVADRARAPESHWQIAYNLACLHAVRARRFRHDEPAHAADERGAALEWLERCLDRPSARQLVREWVERDPDLDELRDSDDFKRWCSRVQPITPTAASSADHEQPHGDAAA